MIRFFLSVSIEQAGINFFEISSRLRIFRAIDRFPLFSGSGHMRRQEML